MKKISFKPGELYETYERIRMVLILRVKGYKDGYVLCDVMAIPTEANKERAYQVYETHFFVDGSSTWKKCKP